MVGLFSECCSLKYLPDISKWNTSNLIKIDYILYGCSSLEYLPDISKWNIENIKSMVGSFNGCSLLKSLSDISKVKIVIKLMKTERKKIRIFGNKF